jgi:hypothetical protein
MCTRELNNPPTINLLEEKVKISYFFFFPAVVVSGQTNANKQINHWRRDRAENTPRRRDYSF